MAKLAGLTYFIAAIVCATNALAIPSVSIDLDPSSAGIQNLFAVESGTTHTVDIVVSDVAPGAPLQGFEFSLLFDAVFLGATGVVGGGFLPSPVFTLGQTVGPSFVDFSQLSIGPFGSAGSGVIASVTFSTLAVAAAVDTSLMLEDVILTTLLGVELDKGVNGATLTLAASPSAAPEPSTLVVLGLGLGLSLIHSVRRRKRTNA